MVVVGGVPAPRVDARQPARAVPVVRTPRSLAVTRGISSHCRDTSHVTRPPLVQTDPELDVPPVLVAVARPAAPVPALGHLQPEPGGDW